MNLVLGISLERGKSVGIGGRGEPADSREKETGGGEAICGDCRNKAVESRVRVLALDEDDDAIFGITHEDYSERM